MTVCAASCVGADVAAKAGFLLAERGLEQLAEWGLAARFVDIRGDIVATPAWSRQVEPREAPCT